MLSDTNYVELLTFKIPMLAKKHEQVNDKGLYWERIKMEIRAFTIAFSKKKAKRERDDESILLSKMMRLQTKLQTSYSDRAGENKSKLSKIAGIKTRGTIVRSRARWYEYGERNSRYFNNLEKRNQKKKHITSLVNNDGDKITNPKDILEEEERFFEEIYTSRCMDPNCLTFSEFFETENAL